MVKLKNILQNIISERHLIRVESNKFKYINEQVFKNLVLYRGVEEESQEPTDNDYAYFSSTKEFAEDYGEYIWKCTFKTLNLFISYKKESIVELYKKGFKLRDTHIEFNWGNVGTSYEDAINAYDYDKTTSSDNWGYKSANDFISSPSFGSDTWEAMENTNGVLDYVLSKYDGIVLLEGGSITYYLDTSKIIDSELL